MRSASAPAASSPDLRSLLRQLREAEARAEKAEARADAAQRESQQAREHAAAVEAENRDLSHQVAAQGKIIGVLMRRVTVLTQRLARARNRPEQLAIQFELDAVQRQLDDLNREKFGQTSERRGRPEASPPKSKPEKKPQVGHGPNPQADLARTPQLHLLDEADRVCPTCQPPRPLEPWEGQTVDTEEITVVERTFKVILHQQQVYRCDNCGHIDVALGADRLIPGGRYAPEFAATVAVDKYRDHLPLDRQAKRMGELGLQVTSQTLWDQLRTLYVLLLPTYLLLQTRILESAVIHADETHWRVMKKGASKKWWVWVITDGLRVFFLLAATRGQAAARELLRGYDGIVMADRYSVYESLEQARTRAGGEQLGLPMDGESTEPPPTPDYTLAACWMHARRGFVEAARHGEVRAEAALDFIAALYAVEDQAQAEVAAIDDPETRPAALLEARRRLRHGVSRGVIERLRLWLDSVPTVAGLPLHDAVRWVRGGWTQLTRFLDDPRIPLDNGEAERAVRGIALGRNNHRGSRSEAGTQVAALFYTLVESCRLVGVDARAWLIEAARRAIANRDSVFLPEDYARMLAASSTPADQAAE